MIFKLDKKDKDTLNKLGAIWLKSNITTHNFIDAQYWHNNYEDVLNAFEEAEIVVYTKNGNILGFCGLVDNYIAGMFVDENERNQNIGTNLLQYLQKEKEYLSLKVYKRTKKQLIFIRKTTLKLKS
ncbi:GNAT family N-acetyltransferase [Mammaliicoccus sciuri]|uniref:GNAT family N-acetyltransferase n=1 Tax=Mammaliicoccus sciuri TaxID=1296 RepID=UPI001F49B7E8|nr:GNAT family N-acetyltransferase [Mammaliicoccus sciuri]